MNQVNKSKNIIINLLVNEGDEFCFTCELIYLCLCCGLAKVVVPCSLHCPTFRRCLQFPAVSKLVQSRNGHHL